MSATPVQQIHLFLLKRKRRGEKGYANEPWLFWRKIKRNSTKRKNMLWCGNHLFDTCIILQAVVASAYPADQACSSSTTSGTIHRTAIQRSTSRTLAFAGVACGGTITAGTTQTLSLSDSRDQYTIEAVASAGTSTAWGLGGSTCSRQRRYNTVPSFTVPSSGTVTLRVAWATSKSTVYTSQDCTYAVSPATPSCNACSANQYISSTSPCTCTNCPAYSSSPAASTTVTDCSCIAGDQKLYACSDIADLHAMFQ